MPSNKFLKSTSFKISHAQLGYLKLRFKGHTSLLIRLFISSLMNGEQDVLLQRYEDAVKKLP